MGKLIVWNIVSVDGFFEGPEKWDLRLHEYIWGPDLAQMSREFGEEMGLLVFGRVTYEGMAAYWPNAGVDNEDPAQGEDVDQGEDVVVVEYMNETPKLVASRTLAAGEWRNTEVTADIVGELTRRKALSEKPIYVFGSAELTHSLLEAGLVDELLIGIAPVILGAGTPLFKPSPEHRRLTLLEARTVDTGGVVLRYAADSSA